MKTETTNRIFRHVVLLLALAGFASAFLGGCISKNSINSYTSTVLGMQLDQNQNGVPSVKLGLIRSEWHVVPVTSNQAPDFIAVTDTELRPFGADKVHRAYATGAGVKSKGVENWIGETAKTDTGKP